MALLFPQIEASDRRLIREMAWHELLQHEATGASPAELAAALIAHSKATGNGEECAALLMPLLEELAATSRATRDGERFVAFKTS